MKHEEHSLLRIRKNTPIPTTINVQSVILLDIIWYKQEAYYDYSNRYKLIYWSTNCYKFMFSTRTPSSERVRSCALEVRSGVWSIFDFEGHNATKNKKYTS